MKNTKKELKLLALVLGSTIIAILLAIIPISYYLRKELKHYFSNMFEEETL